MEKIILDLCGGTGSWSEPYRQAGYDVRVVTLPQFDVLQWENYSEITAPVREGRVYGILAAPPCTMFSFARSTAKKPRNLREGMTTVEACLKIVWAAQHGAYDAGHVSSFKFWALENPFGYLRRFLGEPAYEFHPYDFGDRYSKRTQLWGMFNPPTKSPVVLSADERDASYRNINAKLPSISDIVRRQDLRSITPAGFANAFFSANR